MTPHRYEVFHNPEDIRDSWIALERTGTSTPYQRYDLITSWLEQVAVPNGFDTAIVVVRDLAGDVQGLFPFSVEKLGPFRVLRFAGGKHMNFNMGLFAATSAADFEADCCRDLLRAAGAATGAHLAVLTNQPFTWQGFPNPLAALPSQPSPEPAYKVELTGTFEEFSAKHISKDARNKLRRKERRLSDIGPVHYKRAETALEVRATLHAFFSQKTARFRQSGKIDVFASSHIRGFIERACLACIEPGGTGIELYYCTAGERIVATYGAAIDGNRFSGMFTSFDNAEDVFRWSPGDLLLMNIIEIMYARGLATFDLGVGEAKYKETYCDQVEPLFDTILPLTAIGYSAAFAYRWALAAKQHVKHSPRLLAILNHFRKT